jgi:hypothetical protein
LLGDLAASEGGLLEGSWEGGAPSVEFGFHGGDAVGLGGGEVLLLGAVGEDIVEFDTGEGFIVQEDVVAFADGVGGPVGFLTMRATPFPEDGLRAGEGFTFEGGENVQAVAGVAVRGRDAGGGEEGGEDVDTREDAGFVDATGGDVTGPADDEGDVDAAEVEAAFAAAKATSGADAVVEFLPGLACEFSGPLSLEKMTRVLSVILSSSRRSRRRPICLSARVMAA